jgi:hypothetical protein
MTAMATPTPAQPLVFPVGHYTGAFHPTLGAPVKYHSLRIGRLAVTLPDERALAVWAAAHRPPDQPDEPWTRAAVAEAARTRLGVADPTPVLAELLDSGLLAEVTPGTPDAVDFARAHRVVPLMMGLGNTPEEPLRYGVGLFGYTPVVRVPSLVYDVWQWGSLGASLWDVCQAFAQAGAEAEVSDSHEQHPEYVLTTYLNSLQQLLGPNAAYIDEARPA